MQNAQANYSHQHYLFEPACARPVIVLGAGSVGSQVVNALASMGIDDITVYDGDTVMSDNVPMSLYGPCDVGRYKVEALQEIVHRLTGVTIKLHAEMYAGQRLANCSVVACVDLMEARKLIWNKVKMHPTIDILCDTRTREAYSEVIAIEPTKKRDIERYENLLFDDEFELRQMCGRHSVMYVSMRTASVVPCILAHFWQYHEIPRWRPAERCDTLERVF
jgi:hypothetical protein